MTQEVVVPVDAPAPVDCFDIGSMDTVTHSTFRVSVIDYANGEPKSGFVIVGKNSEEYRKAAHHIRVEGLMRASKRKSLLDTSSTEGAESMAEAIEINDIRQATAVVVDWFGFANNGVVAPYDAAVVKRMLVKFPTWRQKVLDALENDANFIKG